MNDEPSGTPFASLTLGGDLYTLSGNRISLSHGIAMTTTDWTQEFVNLPLTFSGSQSVSAATNLFLGGPVVIPRGTLTFSSGMTGITGVVSGSGGIAIGGPGNAAVNLGGSNTYSGPTSVGPRASLRAYAAKALGATTGGTTVAGGGQLLIEQGGVREPITLNTATGVGSPVLSSDGGAWNFAGPLNLAGVGQVEIDGAYGGGWGPAFSIDGPVTGSAGIQVSRVVSFTNSTNTFTGTVTVGFDAASQSPIDFLGIGTSGAAGRSSGITILGGGLHLSDTATATTPCSVAVPITLDGSTVSTWYGTADYVAGPVTIGSHGADFANVAVTGNISGSGPVYTDMGTSTTFSGTNTFTGDVTAQGTLIAVGDSALGQASNAITVTYGELELVGLTTLNQNITLFDSPAIPTVRVMCSPTGQCGTVTDNGSITVVGGRTGSAVTTIAPDTGETFVIQGTLQGDSQQWVALGGAGLVDIPAAQPYQGTLDARHLLVGGNASIANVAALYADDLQVTGPQTFSVAVHGGSGPGIENLWGDTTWTSAMPAVDVTVDSGSVTFNNVAGPVGKFGPGVLTLTGQSANMNGGQGVVKGGTLLLDKPPQVSAAPGGLAIGNSLQSASPPALVQLLAPGQLGPQANITLLCGGTLDLNGFNDTIGALTMAGGTLATGGGQLTLGGDVSGQGTVDGNLDLGGSTRTVRVDYSSVLRIGGTLSGAGSGILVSNSNGVLVYPAGSQQTYSGATTVAGGLQVDGALTSSPVTVDSGGMLRGTGSLGALSGDGMVAPGDGPLAPGTNGSQTGNLTVASASPGAYSTMEMLVTEPGCITCASSLSVTGSLDLSAAPTLSVFAVQPGIATGTKYTIVNNESLLPVLGFFKGLPEGSTFTGGSYRWQITYLGGDGNDVVITSQGPVTATSTSATGALA